MGAKKMREGGGRIKVLIADSHPVFRHGMAACLESASDMVVSGQAGAGHEVPARLEAGGHDVVLLDPQLPGGEGYSLLKQIKEGYPALPVLLVSATPDLGWLLRGIRAGASGVVLKKADPEDFCSAIRRVHAGYPYITGPLADKLVLYYQRHENEPLDERLSRREFEVMQLLSQGLKLTEVARKLSLSHQTVATHRRHIMGKMGLRSTAEIVRYGVINGLDGSGMTVSARSSPWGRMTEG